MLENLSANPDQHVIRVNNPRVGLFHGVTERELKLLLWKLYLRKQKTKLRKKT